jgi:hypothetical protein
MILLITDSYTSFTVDEQGAIDLELKLNVTLEARALKTTTDGALVGDMLFAFGTKDPQAKSHLFVTSKHLAFLWKLVKKPGWSWCTGMRLDDPDP